MVLISAANKDGVDSDQQWKLFYSQLKEKIITDYIGFVLHMQSFIFEQMNRKVVQFVESGLAQKFTEKYKRARQSGEEGGPKVLTLEHLNSGFYIWLVCVCIAVVVFMIEHVFERAVVALTKRLKIDV